MSELSETVTDKRANGSPEASAADASRRKTLLMAAGGLLAVAAIVGILVPTVFLKKDSGSSNDAASLQVSTQTASFVYHALCILCCEF
jgi:hypothetical protein